MVQVENPLQENFKNKIALLKMLLGETQKVRDCITQDDMEGLMDSLNERERLMQEIDKLDAAKEQLMKLLGVKAGTGLNTRALASLKGYQDEIRELLEKIEKLDKDNREGAQQKKEAYQKQVQLSRQMKKGIQTYTSPYSSEDGIYIDAKK